jgi:hypothetical protein
METEDGDRAGTPHKPADNRAAGVGEKKHDKSGEEEETFMAQFRARFGVMHVRGCEVQCVMDSERTIVSDPNPGKRATKPVGMRE